MKREMDMAEVSDGKLYGLDDMVKADCAGCEGLIHVSEMSWSQHLRSAQDFMKVGDEVEAVILTLLHEGR